MKTAQNSLLLTLLLLLPYCLIAQNITGLWEIKTVNVGKRNMTPVAKWTKINTDGTFQSGNGWLQNAEGTWTFEDAIFLTNIPLGLKDPFGGFKVSFIDESMIWERMEEGMMVKVTLVKIKNLPKAPADYLVGLWDLVKIEKDKQDLTDSLKREQYIFIRWDRLYNQRTIEGKRKTGYWHINGHRPEITFLPHSEGETPESWRVEVNDEVLILTGISDTNRDIKKHYKRLNEFPK